MKIKTVYTYLVLFLLPDLFITAAAQKRITEGKITYDLIINTGEKDPKIADMFDGATSTLYIKGKSSRWELVSSLGKQSIIIDGKTGNATELREYGDSKYMITMTPENWKESNKKYEGTTFSYYEEYKSIQGYNCQKALGKMKDGTEFTVYFTRELIPENKDFQYANKDLPGLAMEYESAIGNLKVIYRVSQISFNVIPAATFDLPKTGFRVLTFEESNKIGN